MPREHRPIRSLARTRRVAAEAKHSEASTKPDQRTEHAAIGWAQRLRRVNGREIERCAACGGRLRIIARQSRIGRGREKILGNLRRTNRSVNRAAEARGPRCRAPPRTSPLG